MTWRHSQDIKRHDQEVTQVISDSVACHKWQFLKEKYQGRHASASEVFDTRDLSITASKNPALFAILLIAVSARAACTNAIFDA